MCAGLTRAASATYDDAKSFISTLNEPPARAHAPCRTRVPTRTGGAPRRRTTAYIACRLTFRIRFIYIILRRCTGAVGERACRSCRATAPTRRRTRPRAARLANWGRSLTLRRRGSTQVPSYERPVRVGIPAERPRTRSRRERGNATTTRHDIDNIKRTGPVLARVRKRKRIRCHLRSAYPSWLALYR